MKEIWQINLKSVDVEIPEFDDYHPIDMFEWFCEKMDIEVIKMHSLFFKFRATRKDAEYISKYLKEVANPYFRIEFWVSRGEEEYVSKKEQMK